MKFKNRLIIHESLTGNWELNRFKRTKPKDALVDPSVDPLADLSTAIIGKDMVKDWQVLERRRTEDYQLFQIETKKVRSPRTHAEMKVQAIHFPDWAVVLPITPDKKVIMVHQYRHGNERISLELPGGLVDADDESPKSAVKRELMEETGYGAQEIIRIGEAYPQPAVLSNRCFFYLATEVTPVGGMALDAGEDIGLDLVPLDSIAERISCQEIDSAMTILAFSYFFNGDIRLKMDLNRTGTGHGIVK